MCFSYTDFRENGFLTVSKMSFHLLMLRAKATCSVNYSSVFSSEHLSPFNLSLFFDEVSSSKNAGVRCHALLQGIFPIQGLNPALPHCRQILYCLSHQRSPRKLEWVAYPFFKGSSRPRNRTGVSCIARGFFSAELPGQPFTKSYLNGRPYGRRWGIKTDKANDSIP